MASTQILSATAQDRKARLAQLKSLKRKNPDPIDDGANDQAGGEALADPENAASKYLSGRNYDTETKGAKLGFENAPSGGHETLEQRASVLEEATRTKAKKDARAEQPLDLFTIQPKKPNWDLKRDLERKLTVLNVRTDNAIARLVRERISRQQNNVSSQNQHAEQNGHKDGDAAGIDGTSLVEATHLREREDEEEARRELEEEADDDALQTV